MSLTPKPWKYGTRRDGSKWLSLGDPTRGQHRQGDLVATKEDADLICAAHDLLAELKKIVHDWDGEPEDMIEAIAAIAKAEGRSDA